jgi:flagellar hook-associated protein 3 FlgL
MTMQISTSLMFDRAIAQMGVTQDRLSQTQMQLSSSKQVLKPSDAPDKSAIITRMKSVIERQNSYLETMNTVKDKMAQQETALKSADDVITRLKELAVQAANDTNSPQDRQYIGIEVKELRNQLLSLANTQDVNGNYIFSGTRVGKPAFAADTTGKLVYQGDMTVSPAGIGDEREVATNRPGVSPFGKVVRTAEDGTRQGLGFFQAIDDFTAALNANDAKSVQRAVGEMGSLQETISGSLASVGASMNTLDGQTALAEETLLRLKGSLSKIEDVNYAEAITKMNKDMLALEAAQSSFAKISQLNLFNYIR